MKQETLSIPRCKYRGVSQVHTEAKPRSPGFLRLLLRTYKSDASGQGAPSPSRTEKAEQRRPGLLNLSTQRFLHHHALSSGRLNPAPPGECSLGLHDQLAPEPTWTQRGTIDPSYRRGARLYIETEKAGWNGDIPVEKPTPQPEVPYFPPLQVGSLSVTYSPVL